MRIILAILALAAVVAGAAVFVLAPSTRTLSRTIEIIRPPGTVFALASDLRTFPEYLPWIETDPGVAFTAEGAAGVGQSLVWRSRNPAIGAGRLTTERVDPAVGLAARLERAPCSGALDLDIAKTLNGARVTWNETLTCPRSIGAIGARLRLGLGADADRTMIDAALVQLRALAEELPEYDLGRLEAAVEEAPLTEILAAEGQSSLDPGDSAAAEAAALAKVDAAMTARALLRQGAGVVITDAWDEAEGRYAFRAGYAFSGPLPLDLEGVAIARTPAGLVVRAMHRGPRDRLAETYAYIDAYLRARRLTAAGAPWHRLGATKAQGSEGAGPTAGEPGAEAPTIEIFFPVIDSRAETAASP
jgi:hypothetical protein